MLKYTSVDENGNCVVSRNSPLVASISKDSHSGPRLVVITCGGLPTDFDETFGKLINSISRRPLGISELDRFL